MRRVWLIGGLVLAFLFQVSFFGAAHLLGVAPNILLVAVVLLVPVLAPPELVATAVGIGFVLDMVSGADFGLRTAFFVMAALALLVLRNSGVDSERPVTALLLILAAGLAYNVVIATGLVASGTFPAPWTILSLGLREFILDAVCLVVLRFWVVLLGREGGTLPIRRRAL